MAVPDRLRGLAESIGRRAEPFLPAGDRAVALSGGADSAACAWISRELGGGPTRALFVHHGLPGSDLMAEAARAVAGSLGLGLEELEAEVAEGPSPEGQARAARYRALHAALRPGEWLLVGHTADDQAETVLGNLLRGAGPEGLAGIPRVRGRVVRPLLDVTRTETRELATLLGLPWREDPANLRTDLRRNELRRWLIPLLEERYNPALRRVLCRTARILGEDEALLGGAAARIPLEVSGEAVRLPGPLLATLPRPLAARAVRRALRAARGPHAGRWAEVEAVLRVAAGAPAATLGGDLRVEREGALVTLWRTRPEPPLARRMTLPGEVVFGPWRLTAWLEEDPPLAWPLSAWSAVFDPQAAGDEALVRPAAEGGRIALDGGHKPIREALAEGGVPERLRGGWPVVETGGRVLWIPGVRSSPAGWIGEGAGRYLWLSAEERAGEEP